MMINPSIGFTVEKDHSIKIIFTHGNDRYSTSVFVQYTTTIVTQRLEGSRWNTDIPNPGYANGTHDIRLQ